MIGRGRLLATVLALLATAVLLGLGVATFHHGTATTKPVVLPFDLFWCAKDDDCVIVERIGCCDCDQGGAQGAVTKWHADELRLFLKSACRPRPVCVQLDLCRHDVKAVCEDHACRMVPDRTKKNAAAAPAAQPPAVPAGEEAPR